MSTARRLPEPRADQWDWQRHGACRGRDSAQFFHPDGERGSSRARREEAAKIVCGACPVRAECAAHALTAREPYGVWGGFTEGERLQLHTREWGDLVDVARGRADVSGLEARLALLAAGLEPHRPGHPVELGLGYVVSDRLTEVRRSSTG